MIKYMHLFGYRVLNVKLHHMHQS